MNAEEASKRARRVAATILYHADEDTLLCLDGEGHPLGPDDEALVRRALDELIEELSR